MKIFWLSLFVLLAAVLKMSAALYDEVYEDNSELNSSGNVDSFDEIFIIRYFKEQEPQLVEITNPVHKIIVSNIADEQLIPRMLFNLHKKLVMNILKKAGKMAAKEICAKFMT